MSRNQKITLGVWVSICALVVGLIASYGKAENSYGRLENRVKNVAIQAEKADNRSQGNQVLINRIDSKLDMILEQVRK